jgi:pSer/pThr/pTyr-binding forkhead associated (FHA) protein
VFKIIAVGGKLRGQEIILNEGDNVLGRSLECDFTLKVDGVSKKHLKITVNGKNCFVQDLNSSNGTFVNGKIIKKATVGDKDKITLPNVIFQLVYVKENKKIIKKQVLTDDAEADLDDNNLIAPKDFFGKIKFMFKHKLMKVLYSFNEQYEWSVMLGILLFLFICTNIAITIGPVLLSTKDLVFKELKLRGTQYANEITRANSAHLASGRIDKNYIKTEFLEDSAVNEGIQSYELIDMEGRVIRPISRMDTYSQDALSTRALTFYKTKGKSDETYINTRVNPGEIGIARVLRVANNVTGDWEPKGIISIRFKPESIRQIGVTNKTAYFESLIMTSIVAVFFFGIFYYLTTRPIEEIKSQIEEVLRGKRKELETKGLFSEISPLRSSINSLLQRIKELQNDDVDSFQDIEDDAEYVASLFEFMQGAPGAVVVLNSEKNIEYVNEKGYDLTGMRENLVKGQNVSEAASNAGIAAEMIELCDNSASNNGTNQNSEYEIGGNNYMIHVNALMGKDSYAKAFYISFVLEN